MGIKKKWIILYFLLLTLVGSAGFYFIGGDEWSYIDSLYMTIITLSTVGYGEVHSLNNLGKIWSILIIIFGVTGIGAFIRTLNEEFNQLDIFRKKALMNKIKNLKNHYIICGYGRMGAVIAEELQKQKLDFLIIEKNDDKVNLIKEKGYMCISGDATSEQVIQDSQIIKATGVSVVLNNDQDNLFVTMSMKTLNPDIFIISRCAKQENQTKLLRAGANKVINPYTAGGHRMAAILSKPQVEDSISVISPKHSDINLTIEEISLRGLFEYENKTIKQSKIREDFGLTIVGIIKMNGESTINPNSNTKLSTSDKILLIGSYDKIKIFEGILPAV